MKSYSSNHNNISQRIKPQIGERESTLSLGCSSLVTDLTGDVLVEFSTVPVVSFVQLGLVTKFSILNLFFFAQIGGILKKMQFLMLSLQGISLETKNTNSCKATVGP